MRNSQNCIHNEIYAKIRKHFGDCDVCPSFIDKFNVLPGEINLVIEDFEISDDAMEKFFKEKRLNESSNND